MPNLRFLNNGEIKTNHKGRNMKDLVETLWFLDLPRLGEIFQLSFRQFEVFRECFLLKDKRSMSEFLSTLIVCESDFTPNFASDNKLVFYMEYFYIFTSWWFFVAQECLTSRFQWTRIVCTSFNDCKLTSYCFTSASVAMNWRSALIAPWSTLTANSCINTFRYSNWNQHYFIFKNPPLSCFIVKWYA